MGVDKVRAGQTLIDVDFRIWGLWRPRSFAMFAAVKAGDEAWGGMDRARTGQGREKRPVKQSFKFHFLCGS